MVENKETEPESEKDTGKKTVFIDVILNDIRYCGDVEVDKDGNVDLKDIMPVDSARTAYIGSRVVATVVNILKATALATAGEGYDANIRKCHISGWYGFANEMVVLADGEYAYRTLTVEWEGEYYDRNETEEHQLRRGDGSREWVRAPESFWNSRYYCSSCECYIEYDEDYYGSDECIYCREERRNSSIIEGYSESHEHKPIYFGSYKGDFVGLGFELEVDCEEDDECDNEETAEGLCSACGLDEDEMRFAHDGSLNYGFECISQPHTVKDFWDKADKWRKMLRYLAHAGYTSHNAGTCGLHVHVSREMFGKNEEEQDRAISKVYAFFDENWSDLVKVSRRTNFDFCDKNKLRYEEYQDTSKSLYAKWKKTRKGGSHYVALNNGNYHTFEYRLGRGTLNAWSFFAWIDLVLTITKNARRITIEKVTSNDLLSWLGGIKESTAKYIYKRGAFRDAMKALYPAVEWESDMTDN